MKPSEKEVLETLRKTTLAYLSESDYAQIEKAVEQKGILNLTGTAAILVKSAVQKHEGGGHDQASHGSWAGNGAGGKNIQDMSASDQKEFIDRMGSAKSGAEQRTIIDEFKGRQKGETKGGEYSVKSTKEFAGGSYHGVDTNTTPSVLDKLFGRGRDARQDDEFEPKVTESWTAEFKNNATGKTFVAEVYDWMRYDQKGLSVRQGFKQALLPKNESYNFHIGADSKEQAQIVSDYITSNQTSGVNKATSLKNGDMVSWQASGGTARGKIEHIMRDGVLGIPKSSFSIKAEKDDPAVLIRIYRDGEETETLVGHKASTLKKA
jgi:hypothetical protein